MQEFVCLLKIIKEIHNVMKPYRLQKVHSRHKKYVNCKIYSNSTKSRTLSAEMSGDCDVEKPGTKHYADHVASACAQLKRGEIIAVPTDTIYGVAGLAQSTEAVARIYNIKMRDFSKPIAICVGDVADVEKWGKVVIPAPLLSQLLPGAVTVVLERTCSLNPDLNPGTELVGIRVPDSGFVRDVASLCGEPLALTSANRSNAPSTVNVQEFRELWPQLGGVYDGGMLGEGQGSRLGSTVVDLSKPGAYTIIRRGSAYTQTVNSLEQFGLKEEVKT